MGDLMKILKSDSFFINSMGKQEYNEDKDYKISKYIVTYMLDNGVGVILMNTMTMCIILVSLEEYNNIVDGTIKDCNTILYRYLIDNWWVVPNNIDVKSIAYTFKNTMIPKPRRNHKFSKIVILPTTGCNARCPYCYEQGTRSVSMTEETAHDVSSWIMKNSDSFFRKLHWFGGEPLYNMQAIDTICGDLNKNCYIYSSTMVSNGYLFDKDIAKKAKNLWNLRWIQITLDGTKENYANIKNYQGTYIGDPFNRVLSNIGYLLDNNIKVTMRLNMNGENTEDLYKLVDILHSRFKDTNANIYPIPLLEGTDVGYVQRTNTERGKIYHKASLLEKYIQNYSMLTDQFEMFFNHYPYSIQCMADDPNVIMITPEGNFGKCDHHIDDQFCGSIYTGIDEEMFLSDKYTKHVVYPECDNCVYYPLCNKLKNCSVECMCNDNVRQKRINMLKYHMISTYNEFKTKGDSR